MNINLRKLVYNSNFNQVHFLLNPKFVKDGDVLNATINFGKNKGKSDIAFTLTQKFPNCECYDLRECVNLVPPYSAHKLAFYLEKSRLFEFDCIDICDGGVAYITLKIKK